MDPVDTAVAFHFALEFTPGGPGVDAAFQEASGIGAEMETEAYREGGENRFVYQLPKGVKNPRLALKRGVAPMASPLVAWCRKTLEGGLVERIETRQVHLSLLDREGQALRKWAFASAYPVQWSVDELRSNKNELALEKIELVYAEATREM